MDCRRHGSEVRTRGSLACFSDSSRACEVPERRAAAGSTASSLT